MKWIYELFMNSTTGPRFYLLHPVGYFTNTLMIWTCRLCLYWTTVPRLYRFPFTSSKSLQIHIIMHPPRGLKGQGVADRQHEGCIIIFAGFSVSISILHILQVSKGSYSLLQLRKVNTGYYRLLQFTIARFRWLLCLIWLI